MNKRELAEMIHRLRKTRLEQLGGMGKYKGGAVDLQDLSSPNRPVGKSSREQHHMKEVFSKTIHSGLGGKHNPRRAAFSSNLGNLRSRSWQTAGTNQKRNPGTYGNTAKPVAEAEQDIGDTMTTKKKVKRRETIELEPKQSDEKIF